MATTASDLIEETLALLQGDSREEINLLSTAITDTTSTSVVVADSLGGIQAGSVICIDTEEMYVRSVTASTLTATVIRGFRGSTAATHSANAQIQVRPHTSRFRIFNAINDELRALSGQGIFQMKTVNLTFNAAVGGYNMTSVTAADVVDIYSVRYKDPNGTSKEWPPVRRYELVRNMASTDFASTLALMVYDAVPPGQTVRVQYRARLGTFSATSDNISSVTGLHAEAFDLPVIGAAWRLTTASEVRRNFTEAQGDSRRAEEVPPGSTLRAAGGLFALRRQRISEERGRLMAMYPPKAV